MAATSTILPPTNLQEAIGYSREIRNNLQDDDNADGAIAWARSLYKGATEMVIAELGGRSWIPYDKTVHPIIANLGEVEKLPAYHNDLRLQRAISKVFRVFCELGWYQPWRLGAENNSAKIRVSDDLRNEMISTASLIESILETRDDMTGARFELRCATEAAKRLTPSTKVWQTYASHLADLTTAGLDKSAEAIWNAFKPFAADLARDCPLGWYLWYQQVHIFRWESTLINTVDEFQKKVASNISLCEKEGGNLSLCLATIFIELIKKPNIDPEVKKRAFSGITTETGVVYQPGLIHLLSWKRLELSRKRLKNVYEFLKHPVEIYHKIFRKADRFWETRDVTTSFIVKLATKDKYAAIPAESVKL